jgi:hypothetical protein
MNCKVTATGSLPVSILTGISEKNMFLTGLMSMYHVLEYYYLFYYKYIKGTKNSLSSTILDL